MTHQWQMKLDGEPASLSLGAMLALFAARSDVIALHGDLGAGKSTVARALIRALARDDDGFEVPSPTFTLVQAYDFTRVPVSHFDFYRIESASEIEELGWDDALETGLTVIEWPDRLGPRLPPDRLDVELADADGGRARQATLRGHGCWEKRLERMKRIAEFVAGTAFANCTRTFLQGDASARRYERLICPGGGNAILMDMPAQPNGPVMSNGRTYGQIVHLAEGVKPFAAMTWALREAGLNAPELHSHDLASGLLVIADFGDRVFGTLPPAGEEVETAYEVACDILVKLANTDCASSIPLRDGSMHEIADYDATALHTETALLTEWFWPHLGLDTLAAAARDEFAALWDELFAAISPHPTVWVLRDYHSPNLMWLPREAGVSRIGLLDYQDAVMGSPAYDLASLLQDARIDVSAAREEKFLRYYLKGRARADAGFDELAFLRDYAILGAQRATKILGIFARLNARDGKPHYLKHLPRVSEYLERNLVHPDLAALKQWFGTHLPHDVRAAS